MKSREKVISNLNHNGTLRSTVQEEGTLTTKYGVHKNTVVQVLDIDNSNPTDLYEDFNSEKYLTIRLLDFNVISEIIPNLYE